MANMTTLLSGKAMNVPLYYTFMLHTANHAYLHTLRSVSGWLQRGEQLNYKLTFVQWNKSAVFSL